ncbi:MAG: CDP-archaeol synthase [Candidatus Helarchaeota archaeon]
MHKNEAARKMQKEPLDSKEVRNIKIFCTVMGVANAIFIITATIVWSPYEWPIFLGLGMLGSAPAFIGNAGMTLTGTWGNPGQPMDFGKNFIDGKRILGEGKTWKGFFGGIIVGITIGLALILIYIPLTIAVKGLPPANWARLGLVDLNEVLFFTEPTALNFIIRTILLAIGGCVGDAVGSFIKRRFNKPRGAQFFILDQIDFLLIAYLCAYIVFPLPWYYMLTILLFTPLVVVLNENSSNTFI